MDFITFEITLPASHKSIIEDLCMDLNVTPDSLFKTLLESSAATYFDDGKYLSEGTRDIVNAEYLDKYTFNEFIEILESKNIKVLTTK